MKIEITATSHPRIFNVCLLMLHDNGAINRLERSPVQIFLKAEAVDLSIADAMLARLSPEEYETFAIGEDGEVKRLAKKYALTALDETLNDWFEEGMERR